VTARPPAGAAELIVTVPVEETPPTTEVGLRATEESAGAVTVKVAVLVVPPVAAEIVTDALAATAMDFTVKVAVLAAAATVTEAGTVAAVELLVNVTTVPPVGATALSVTVPVEEAPPATEVGDRATEEGVTAVAARAGPARAPENPEITHIKPMRRNGKYFMSKTANHLIACKRAWARSVYATWTSTVPRSNH